MDRKALIAVVVCGVIMLLYYPFIMPLLTKKKAEPPDIAIEEVAARKETGEKQQPSPVTITPTTPSPATGYPIKEVILENDHLKTVWTSEGASLKSVKLKQFKDPDAKEILDMVKDADTKYHPLAIHSIFQKTGFQTLRYSVIEQSENRATFAARVAEGINLIKAVAVTPGKYDVTMDVTLENTTDAETVVEYGIVASSMIAHEGEPANDMAAVLGVDTGNRRTKLLRTALKEMPSRNESAGIVWTGSVNRYFATILRPLSSEWVASINVQAMDMQGNPSNEKATPGDFMVSLQTNKIRIPPHESVKHSYFYFAGPKKEEVLKQYETLDTILDYGWLTSISKALLAFLNAVYKMVPNYGISIIILTVVIKALLFPLTRKSQASMFRMQQLQPMINQLKEKYKHDKQKMGKEQMFLFKKYGVNPMSGCFPMLLQLPVFLALFRTLQLSFEMRQAPFCFWINDLSRPDTLMHLPFSIPFIGNALNVLPLIMTAASFAQMKTTPKSPAADPQAQAQQKMMSFMPIIFAFILYHMPSGLTIYWTTSTLFSILESVIIRKSIKKIKFH